MSKANLSLAQTQQRFQKFYQNNLHDIYADLEKDRRYWINYFWKTLTVVIIGTALICYIIYYGQTHEASYMQWFDMVVSVWILGSCIFLCKPFYTYASITKARVMKKILSFWGDLQYNEGGSVISDSLIKKSELFGYFNKEVIDDAFSGSYKDVKLKVSEHNLRIKGSKGDTNIFKGILIMLDFSKQFSGKTIALNRWRFINILYANPLLFVALLIVFLSIVFTLYYYVTEPNAPLFLLFTPLPTIVVFAVIIAGFYFFNRYHYKPKATQKVVLEGIPFLKQWQVQTDNQVEARYILTPKFMERMLNVKRLFHGRNIDFSFFDNKVLIAIHTNKNMFETTSLFTSALSYHKVREVISQLHSIFAIIEEISQK